MKLFFAVIFLGIIFASQAEAKVVGNGAKVTIDYVLIVDGKIMDTTEGRAPFQYTQGESKIISGLSKGLEGMAVGDEKTLTLRPEEAYGNVNPKAFKEVSKTLLPANLELAPGKFLSMKTVDDRVVPARISEVKSDTVVLDLNHPLAGKELCFKVKIRDIQ